MNFFVVPYNVQLITTKRTNQKKKNKVENFNQERDEKSERIALATTTTATAKKNVTCKCTYI